jgi:hypothetical protein
MILLMIQANANVCMIELRLFLQKKNNVLKSKLNLQRE